MEPMRWTLPPHGQELLRQCADLVRDMPPMQLLAVPPWWPGPITSYDSDGTRYALFTRDVVPLDAGPSIRFPWDPPDAL
jgi:hypothetical protein